MDQKNFNPRSRKGSDFEYLEIRDITDISIHAPAKGATVTRAYLVERILLFQSTLPQRERLTPPQKSNTHCRFQSTLPQRERPELRIKVLSVYYFNPRSRKGSDYCLSEFFQRIQYFNPRSRKGSDFSIFWNCPAICYFNPRSRKGSDTTVAV